MDFTVTEGRFQQGEGGQASLGEVEGSMSGLVDAKLSRRIYRVLVSLHVWPNLKWERRLGDEKPAHEMTEQTESKRFVGEVEKAQRGEMR